MMPGTSNSTSINLNFTQFTGNAKLNNENNEIYIDDRNIKVDSKIQLKKNNSHEIND
jgi:hypothetical protein